MANNPYVNKVEYAGQTIMDLTGDTATPSDVMSGVTFHDRSGAPQTGSLITHNVYDGLDSTSTSDALSAKQGKVLNDKISYIGSVEYGNTNSSTVSVGDDTAVLVGSVSLTKGRWIVVGCADWATNSNGYRQIAFKSTSLNPPRNTAVTTLPVDGKESYQQLVMLVYNTETTSIDMYARQTSGSALNIYPYLYAMRFRAND